MMAGHDKRNRGWRAGSLFVLVAALALLTSASAIASAAPKTKTETVEFKSGDQTISGFLAEPDGAGKHPAMIVIHEWWGLNDWVKEQAEKLAGEGYVALAVDLYHGKTATDPAEAHELMRGLPQDRALKDLKAAFDFLAARPDVKEGADIGVIGWCMGGGLALQLAVHEPRLRACVVNYGALPTDPGDLQNIGAPILGNFGALDRGITPDDVKAFEKSMTKLKKFVNLKIYDDAGHGFENPNNTQAYRPEAAEDAWKRTILFLKTVVK
ncbi:MAG: dienelactone hydrolase family protein [Candidatus Acidiferrales bacterium]